MFGTVIPIERETSGSHMANDMRFASLLPEPSFQWVVNGSRFDLLLKSSVAYLACEGNCEKVFYSLQKRLCGVVFLYTPGYCFTDTDTRLPGNPHAIGERRLNVVPRFCTSFVLDAVLYPLFLRLFFSQGFPIFFLTLSRFENFAWWTDSLYAWA